MLANRLSKGILIAVIVLSAALVMAVLYQYQVTSVPVLTRDVPAGTVIGDALITHIEMPVNGIAKGWTVVTDDQIKNKRAQVEIKANVPLTVNMVREGAVVDARFPCVGSGEENALKYFLPTDLRHSSGGIVRPCDLVNLLYADPSANSVDWIIQRVRVVGAQTDAGDTVTFGTSGQKSAQPAGFLLALTPTELKLVAKYRPELITLVPVNDDAPSIPDVLSVPCATASSVQGDPCYAASAASGSGSGSGSGAGGTPSPSPSASPSPSGGPIVLPTPTP